MNDLTEKDWAAIEKACAWAAMETRGKWPPEDHRHFSRLVREASERHTSLLNDVDPAQTGPTHSRSTGKPIG